MKQIIEFILKILQFFFQKKEPQQLAKVIPIQQKKILAPIKEQIPMKEESSNVPKIYITLDQYSMGRDKIFPAEWVNTIIDSANVLLNRVNPLLNEINLHDKYVVSSGWRPASINAKVTNAAKRSNHMRGKAIDIMDDKDQNLAKFFLANLNLLEKYGLWMEDPKSTIGKNTNWVHLQSEPPASGNRVFIP